MSDKRTLSFSIAVRSRGGDYDTDSNFQLQPNPLPYKERILKLISDEILTNDNDRRNFLSGFKWCLPPLFMFTLACFEVRHYTCGFVFFSLIQYWLSLIMIRYSTSNFDIKNDVTFGRIHVYSSGKTYFMDFVHVSHFNF